MKNAYLWRSILTFALLKTADDNQEDYIEEVTNTIRQNFYVDDIES